MELNLLQIPQITHSQFNSRRNSNATANSAVPKGQRFFAGNMKAPDITRRRRSTFAVFLIRRFLGHLPNGESVRSQRFPTELSGSQHDW